MQSPWNHCRGNYRCKFPADYPDSPAIERAKRLTVGLTETQRERTGLEAQLGELPGQLHAVDVDEAKDAGNRREPQADSPVPRASPTPPRFPSARERVSCSLGEHSGKGNKSGVETERAASPTVMTSDDQLLRRCPIVG